MIFSDRKLSQKLERSEARSNASVVETRARLEPATGAEWIEVAGAYAMFDGAQSPLTQSFGLGVFEEVGDAELDALEDFFRRHDAPVFHEVSPLADASLMNLLNERGYQPVELTSILFQEIGDRSVFDLPVDPALEIRIIKTGEEELWARTSAAGWAGEAEELADFMFNFGKIGALANGGFPFLAELEGVPISTGMLFVFEDVAILAGASTAPEGRRRGAQNALLGARLKFAAERGCTLAMMGAMPGSQSQRNAEKHGFRVAYTRTKWQLKR